MKKTFWWITCMVSLVLSACSSDWGNETEVVLEDSDVSQNVTRSVWLSNGYSMYGINITSRWADYNVPDQRQEIVDWILENGNTVVYVCLSSTPPSPNTDPYELGFDPYVDNGWRLLLDGSSHDIMILTHVNATNNPTGRAVEMPISTVNPVPCYLCFYSGTYSMESGFQTVDISNYNLYVFIGCNQEGNTNRFYGYWMSASIPNSGEAVYLGHGSLPETFWLYPKMDLMSN